MLLTTITVPDLIIPVQNYLQDTLGISMPGYRPWEAGNELPYFLQDAFEFWEVNLFGQDIVLAMTRNGAKSTVSEVKSRLNKVRSISGQQRMIYVTDRMASYERKRLIEQKMPFIVPGNQLYLPDLGLDLREHFRKHNNAVPSSLSPSTQAMLISALLRPAWEPAWYPSETATMLGYTPMTVSRVVRELVATGITSVHKVGRIQYLQMAFPPKDTWERIMPLLRSPIQRTIWIPVAETAKHAVRLAGLSALARHSMLTEPKQPVYAVNRAQWNSSSAPLEDLAPREGYVECQLWNYSPDIQPGSDTVDPLSLYLTLQGSADERIQTALDELKGTLPW